MSPASSTGPLTACHVVVIPYPGRGHVNPTMNLLKLLANSNPDLLITVVVTEEWLGFIGSDEKLPSVHFATIPNVLPAERDRAANMPRFVGATQTEMGEPFERLLDRLELPVNFIISNTFMNWAFDLGKQRDILVASLWAMPASVFSVFYHFNLLTQNGDHPFDLSESEVIETLKQEFPFPIYTFGPAIPYFKLEKVTSFSTNQSSDDHHYFEWLNTQPPSSVLYVSLGSFLSVSNAQMDEMADGLCGSGVRFLWVARGEATRLQERCGDAGKVVPWCDQLKVLNHPSVGGFWTHCGWNSTMEAIFSGVLVICFPIMMDQPTVRKHVVEDWKTGWDGKRNLAEGDILRGGEIAKLVKEFMDLESDERSVITRRAKELQKATREAISDGGSSTKNLASLLNDILSFS
ncbi:hypothetical protein ACS0TY_034378 [Phlomoides rotata]